MKGVISTFTPEWRSIFHTRYGKPPSNVTDITAEERDTLGAWVSSGRD